LQTQDSSSQTYRATREWVEHVFGKADLPDARLSRRLVETAAALAAQPGQSIHRACETWAAGKGGYRFLANRRVRPEMLSDPVFDEGCSLCEGLGYVFAVQDTTYLNFSHHPSVEGLGPLNNEEMHGLVVHSTIAIRPDGQPLGLLDAQVWVREKGRSPDSPCPGVLLFTSTICRRRSRTEKVRATFLAQESKNIPIPLNQHDHPGNVIPKLHIQHPQLWVRISQTWGGQGWGRSLDTAITYCIVMFQIRLYRPTSRKPLIVFDIHPSKV
jgi:hypothetical protein